MVVLLGIALFVPPNINGVRFRDQLAGSLSAALGRQVRIDHVKYRVFPRPGFDLYGLQVMDDPAFSAEPLLMCGKVAADLRLTSLWQGRLEIANLKLTDDAAPPSLNLVYSQGHLNLESLLLRAEQLPSAPTAKRRAEGRARFPYIEATAGRINVKIGAEKTPFTFSNTDFAVWLAAEDVWHVRLEGQPVRTDMNLNDTGTVRMEGDLRRARDLPSIPLKLDIAWGKAQLGQLTSLVSGRDRGWRGGLSGNAQVSGTPANLHITASAQLAEFRRYDINRNQMPRLSARCQGNYVREALEMKCDTPLGSGGVLLNARWSSKTPRDYDLSAVATRVPLAMLATFTRHARRPVPDDLTATGDLNAAFGFHSHNGTRNWHGTGMTSAFLLQSATAEQPFAVSPVHFHIGAVEAPAALQNKRARQKAQPAAASHDSLMVDPFAVQLGPSTSLEVQATADATGYWIGAKGMVPLERLMALGRATGFAADIGNTTASSVVDLNISGAWTNFAPAKVRGTAHLQNAATWIPGIKNRLVITEADAEINEIELVLAHLKAQFEQSAVAFTGTVNVPWSCPDKSPCPMEFDLHSDQLAMADLGNVLGVTDRGWTIPFFSDSTRLPDFRATGTVSVGEFNVAELPLEKFTAHVEVGGKALLVSHISTKLTSGTADGEWHADWSTSRPRFTATGTLNGITIDRLNLNEPEVATVESWINGRADVKYALRFEGDTPRDMANSVNGRIEYLISNGVSRSLLVDGAKPLKFQTLQGALQIEKQTLRVLPSKFTAANRIYEMSGTVSLIDKQAKLKLSNGTSRWDISGELEKPQISGPPVAETTAARTR